MKGNKKKPHKNHISGNFRGHIFISLKYGDGTQIAGGILGTYQNTPLTQPTG